jgi:glutaredoxin-related protein
VAGAPAEAARITVYGAATCEDTAIARSRLDALEVPHDYVDIDAERAGAAEVARLNDGHRITPTVVREAGGAIEEHVAEPPIERVDEVARAAGVELSPPLGEQLHGPVITRALPFRTLPNVRAGTFSLASLRGRRAAAVLLAHDPRCLACLGYA